MDNRKEYKTIAEVIRRGQLTVNLPVGIILLGFPLLVMGVTALLFSGESMVIAYFIGFVLSFFLAWTWWSYHIAKWRVWAFESTRKSDWAKLRQRAVAGNLIWPEGHRLERTEIRSPEQKRQIQNFNEAINDASTDGGQGLETVGDDPTVPAVLEFGHDKEMVAWEIIYFSLMVVLSIYLLLNQHEIIGILCLLVFIYRRPGMHMLKDIGKWEVQLSIGDEEIFMRRFSQFGKIPWEDTEEITVDTEDGILKMDIWHDDQLYHVTYRLDILTVRDYREFLRILNVYLKRASEAT